MAITSLTIPSVVKSTCEIYSNVSNIEDIRMHVYKWAGTDRITILWEKQNRTTYKTIGKMELHYTELYHDIGELLNDLDYLTNVMVENGFGVLDLRDLNKNREFEADFY